MCKIKELKLFWMPEMAKEYFDRFIRDSGHFENAKDYIHENPVKAGLFAKAEDWEFASARRSAPEKENLLAKAQRPPSKNRMKIRFIGSSWKKV